MRRTRRVPSCPRAFRSQLTRLTDRVECAHMCCGAGPRRRGGRPDAARSQARRRRALESERAAANLSVCSLLARCCAAVFQSPGVCGAAGLADVNLREMTMRVKPSRGIAYVIENGRV